MVWTIIVGIGVITVFVLFCCLGKNVKPKKIRKPSKEIGITEITNFSQIRLGKPRDNFDLDQQITKTSKFLRNSDILNFIPIAHRSPKRNSFRKINHTTTKILKKKIRKSSRLSSGKTSQISEGILFDNIVNNNSQLPPFLKQK
jgi:hypothetical protein